jgi:glycerophosphoryl diester phosphodiesterase
LSPRTVLAGAHRGDPRNHRENTIPAVLASIAAGADIVEIDIKLTADGRLIVLHDDDLGRLWGYPELVSEMTLAEISAACVGTYRVPSFDEMLAVLATSQIILMVDVDEPHVAEAALVTLIQQDLLDKALFAGSLGAMKAVRASSDQARIALSLDALDDLPPAEELRVLAPAYLNPDWALLDASLIERWHADGYGVSCWTVDSPSVMAHLIELDVDVIFSNRIASLVGVIAAQKALVRC